MPTMGTNTEKTPFASASIVSSSPPEVVEAIFFDIDHAIRVGLHEGVTLSRLPPTPEGEFRIRQVVSVPGRVQTEEFVIENGSDGAWVKRFVEGPNVGTRLVARFSPEAGGKYRVILNAYPPEAGFFWGLGKLSSLGMQKALQKTLEEFQRGLASYDADPIRARTRLALLSLGDLCWSLTRLPEAERRSVSTNLLAAAVVVAVADEHADPVERNAIREVARFLCGMELDEDGMEQMVVAILGAVRTQGIEARCDKIGSRLAGLGFAELGVAVAALIALMSQGLDPPERVAMERIAAAAGLRGAQLDGIVSRVDAARRRGGAAPPG